MIYLYALVRIIGRLILNILISPFRLAKHGVEAGFNTWMFGSFNFIVGLCTFPILGHGLLYEGLPRFLWVVEAVAAYVSIPPLFGIAALILREAGFNVRAEVDAIHDERWLKEQQGETP